ncbi:hypothetical protein ACFYMA_16050 [Streptomyces iakyrus]|uniref:hypothetical protein n=1 Tax=Streptomyces iakyrus TaxID=68219 RepID=UPI00369FF84A
MATAAALPPVSPTASASPSPVLARDLRPPSPRPGHLGPRIELLGHAHIGITADVYSHVRLRLQRDAIDALGHALDGRDDEPDAPPAAAVVL